MTYTIFAAHLDEDGTVRDEDCAHRVDGEDCLRRQRDTLQAIVDTLDRTEDDVVITHGMVVWLRHPRNNSYIVSRPVILKHRFQDLPYDEPCYSTKEAAEPPKGKTDA